MVIVIDIYTLFILFYIVQVTVQKIQFIQSGSNRTPDMSKSAVIVAGALKNRHDQNLYYCVKPLPCRG